MGTASLLQCGDGVNKALPKVSAVVTPVGRGRGRAGMEDMAICSFSTTVTPEGRSGETFFIMLTCDRVDTIRMGLFPALSTDISSLEDSPAPPPRIYRRQNKQANKQNTRKSLCIGFFFSVAINRKKRV